MLTFYLDSNILSYLQNPDQYVRMEGYDSIGVVKTYLGNASNNVHVLYSTAHLMDSRKQFNKTPDLALLKLEFINQLTRNNCLLQDLYTKEVRIEQRNAVDLFRSYNSLHDVSAELGDRTKLSTLMEESNLFKAYERLPVNYEQIAEEFKDIPITFKRTKIRPNVYSLMCDLIEQFDFISTDGHLIYKLLRDKMQSEIGIAHQLAGQLNPLAIANQLLPNTETGQLMQEVMTNSFRSDPNNREDIIASYFMNLDALGYRQDKIKRGHGYMSLATDAQHAFYASYCDFFVTNDEPTTDKAKAVYNYLRLPTKVTTLQELAAKIAANSL